MQLGLEKWACLSFARIAGNTVFIASQPVNLIDVRETYDNELAELVLILRPPGPLWERPNVAIVIVECD